MICCNLFFLMFQASVYKKKSYVRNIIKMDSVDSLATFEEKLDIEDLIRHSKPTKLAQIKIFADKEEPLEDLEQSTTVHQGEKRAAFVSAHDGKKQYKLKIEDTILRLYEELDREKYENLTMDVNQRRSLRIREVIGKLELSEKNKELESVNNK